MKRFAFISALLLLGTVLSSSILPPSPDSYGYRVFLQHPEGYTYKCGCAMGTVTAANLKGSTMTIDYTMQCAGQAIKGTMTGTFDSYHNRFTGTYTSNQGHWMGDISFAFNAQGEATGTWTSQHQSGGLEMLLRAN